MEIVPATFLILAFGLIINFALKYVDRDTHASNKAHDHQVAARQNIERKLADTLSIFGHAAGMGWRPWDEEYGAEAMALQLDFRREVEASRSVLGSAIVDLYRKLDTELLCYRDGDSYLDNEGRSISYMHFSRDYYVPCELELEAEWKRVLDRTTHRLF